MKIVNKLKFLLALFVVLSNIHPTPTLAKSSLSVTANVTEVEIGSTVTFTVTVSGGAGSVTVSGATSDSEFIDNDAVQYTVTANEVGTLTLYASGLLCDNEYTGASDQKIEDYEAEYSASCSVTVVDPNAGSGDEGGSGTGNENGSGTGNESGSGTGNENGSGTGNESGSGTGNENGSGNNDSQTTPPPVVKSDDARLWSLSVDKGELKPQFNSSTTTYTVELTSKDTEIKINAEAWDDEAEVEGDGIKAIKLGSNSFSIDVTAEDGTKKTYTINVNVVEVPETYVSFNDAQYGIMKEVENADIPKGFTKNEMTINAINVPVYVNEEQTITLVHAINPEGSRGFYVYKEDEGILGLYRPLAIKDNNIYIVDIPLAMQTKDALKFKTVVINGEEVACWEFEDEELVGYQLLYVLNNEGELGYYLYRKATDQLTAYPESNPITYKQFVEAGLIEKEPINYGLYAGIGGGVLAFLVLVVLLAKKRKKKQPEVVEEVVENLEKTKEFTFDKEEVKEKEPEIVQEVHPIITDLENIKEIEEEELVDLDELVEEKKVEEVIEEVTPITPIIVSEEEEEDDWISDDFYKTILGDEEE